MSQPIQMLAALFIDDIDQRQIAGPTTRIDLGGVQFSGPAPGAESFTWAPHMVVMLHAPSDHDGNGVLEVVFTIDGEQVARNVQPVAIEPGKFAYRLVRAEIEVEEASVVLAHVRVGQAEPTIVPYTILPAVDDAAN